MPEAREATRPQPPRDCPLCPRLVAFRHRLRQEHPDWFDAPVPSFGDTAARLLVVGLAPGLAGANRTGRPFTGDYAGEILYPALLRHGFARGRYDARPDDGLRLLDCRITNAVRCVPPANRPLAAEIEACRRWLVPEVQGEPRPVVLLALGRVAHASLLRLLGLSARAHPFVHGRATELPDGRRLVASYHCSRYNINTGRLTVEMFDEVVALCARLLGVSAAAAGPPAGPRATAGIRA